MSDDARATLALLETAAIERLSDARVRAEALLTMHEAALRRLHADHDSDVAALERLRAAQAAAGSDAAAIARAARAVEDQRSLVAASRTRLERARRARDEAASALERTRHELAQHIARRAAYLSPADRSGGEKDP